MSPDASSKKYAAVIQLGQVYLGEMLDHLDSLHRRKVYAMQTIFYSLPF